MNQRAFESGYAAYQAGDWARAAAEFSQAKSTGEHAGRVDHLLGNCLMKLGRFDDAAAAYADALDDPTYGMVGALCTNRGRALVAAGRIREAVESLAAATEDRTYATPYKAYLALGGAYRALGDVRNAGIAYRNAAIDEANPDPSASLRKLGACFMELGRPGDAIESYRTALDFSAQGQNVNAVNCELALAYVAANRMDEAVDAFEQATRDGSYVLSPEANAAYEAARNAVSARAAGSHASETDDLLAATGYASYPVDPLDPTGETSGNLMPSPEDTGFFSISEEELVNDERKRRRSRGGRVFAVLLVLLLLVAAGLGFAYYSGFGWPMQESVVEDIFAQKTNQGDVESYVSDGLSADAREYIVQMIPSGATITIDDVARSMSNSEVLVTATLPEGGEQRYTITLVRDGIGWKVSGFEPLFASLDGDAVVSEEATPEEQPVEEPAEEQGTEEEPAEDAENGDNDSTSEGTVETE